MTNLISMAIVDSMHDLDEGVSGFNFSEMTFGDDSVEKFSALANSKTMNIQLNKKVITQ